MEDTWRKETKSETVMTILAGERKDRFTNGGGLNTEYCRGRSKLSWVDEGRKEPKNFRFRA